jgi:hypothetical protein
MSLSVNRIYPRVKPEGMLRRDMRWIDGTGYVVSPLDGVNGARRNLLAGIGHAFAAFAILKRDEVALSNARPCRDP